MTAALNGLATILNGGGGFVTVTRTAVVTGSGNTQFVYTVVFGGTLAGVNQPLMSGAGSQRGGRCRMCRGGWHRGDHRLRRCYPASARRHHCVNAEPLTLNGTGVNSAATPSKM